MKQPIAIEEFKVKTKRELNGINYMEFFFGDFENSFEYWNEQSVYLNHSVYKIFHSFLKKTHPKYNDYNVNSYDVSQLIVLKKSLMDVDEMISKKTAEELRDKYQYDGEELKLKLKQICADLIKFISTHESSQQNFWILGM
jgi:hypothetical protein